MGGVIQRFLDVGGRKLEVVDDGGGLPFLNPDGVIQLRFVKAKGCGGDPLAKVIAVTTNMENRR